MRLKLIIFTIFVSIYSIFLYTNTKTKNERVDFDLNKNIENLKTHYNLTMDYFIQDVKSFRNNIAHNKQIIKLFSKAQDATEDERKILRYKLYQKLKPMYERIHSRGILQWQFVFPDNISFLRMHKPSKFGDDLTDVRYSFRYVNKTKKTVIGFEQGRTTHAFRYVFPLFDKEGKHLGAVEVSLSSVALQDKLLTVNKIHSHFLVNKKIFSVKTWETRDVITKYIPSIEHKDYMFAISKHLFSQKLKNIELQIVSKLRDKIDSGIASRKPFAVYTNYKDTMKVITFLPIKNTQKKDVVAYIVSYSNSNNIYNIQHDYLRSNIVIFLGLLFLSYFIYKTLNYKNELELEIKKKTNDLQELNENLEQKIIIEVEKNKNIQKQLFKSEKMASMGEMIGNIAHQWRQPLSVISTASTGLLMQQEFGTITDVEITQACKNINDNAQYLSKTIDDFRNYIQGNREKTTFSLSDNINSFVKLIEGSIKRHNIKIHFDLDDNIKVYGYPAELIQCIINIVNNAKDALYENVPTPKLIFISTSQLNNKAIIKIKDNAGGIPEDILPKIFEPYFTTKHKSQGTGLGLNLTYNLIVDGMRGSIEAYNVKYIYDGADYQGAEFKITL